MKKLLFAAIALLMLGSCSTLKIVDQNAAINAGAAAVQALTISDSQIKQLCSQYMVETDGQNTKLPADNAYTQRLKNIMSRFHNISSLDLNYAVYQSKTVNAFASGDGSVRVYSGLMDVMNDDEVFAVVAHELGHLINKDVRDAYRTAYLIVAARYGIGAFSQTAGAISQGFLGDLGQQLASAAYSRRQETQADETAFQFCVANQVDPFAMYHALNVLLGLSANTGSQGQLTEMFSDHPDTAKRAQHIKEMAEAAGYKLENSPTQNGTATSGGTVKPGKTNTGNTSSTSNTSSGKSGKKTIKKN